MAAITETEQSREFNASTMKIRRKKTKRTNSLDFSENDIYLFFFLGGIDMENQTGS